MVVAAGVAGIPAVQAPPAAANPNGVAFSVWDIPGSAVRAGHAGGRPHLRRWPEHHDHAGDPRRAQGRRARNATFFTVGTEIQKRPDLARRAIAEGDSVQAHTWSHLDLTKLPADQWGVQVDQRRRVHRGRTGVPVKCLRPPYGTWNASVASGSLPRGLTPVMWNDNPGDTTGNSTAQIVSEAVGQAQAGSIIAMHDSATKARTLAALPAIIDGVRARDRYRDAVQQASATADSGPRHRRVRRRYRLHAQG